MSEAGPTGAPSEERPGTTGQLVPRDTTTGTGSSTSGGLSFEITFKSVVYTVSVYAPDPSTSQYGFTVTHTDNSSGSPATVTVASLIYKDESNWQVVASLPKSLQLDSNLTVNQLTIDLTEGTISALPAPKS